MPDIFSSSSDFDDWFGMGSNKEGDEEGEENKEKMEEEAEERNAEISQDMGAEPPTKDDVKEVMEHLDTDHSGKIDFEEFSQLIKDVLSAMIEEYN